MEASPERSGGISSFSEGILWALAQSSLFRFLYEIKKGDRHKNPPERIGIGGGEGIPISLAGVGYVAGVG